MIKESAFHILMRHDRWKKFQEILRFRDLPAAHLMHKFMRNYVAEHEAVNVSDNGLGMDVADIVEEPR